MVSRAVTLFPRITERLEVLGFPNVDITGEEKDSLNMVISEKKPELLLVGAGFHHAATPLMLGRVVERFPKLHVAAVAVHEYPARTAARFTFFGVKSYVSLWDDGMEVFHQGLREVREGGEYISPEVQRVIDVYPEWPDVRHGFTVRLREVLVFLCNGYDAESAGKEMQISRKTVYNDIDRLCDILGVSCRDELVARALELHVVTDEDMCFYNRRKQ